MSLKTGACSGRLICSGIRKYNGTQPGDPAKLGDALVKIASMQNPPKLFIAGSDALDVITPAIEERLREARAHETLSKSTGALGWLLAQKPGIMPIPGTTKLHRLEENIGGG
jgi:aryl-alcohol dehydrogenase-like predicted oxidoreductase